MTGESVPLGAWPGGRVLVLSPTPTHPQDYGNRKRIFQVCSRFAAEGARVTYLHYPAEFEWRGTLPRTAERAMVQTWDQYYTVAPTRRLHAPAADRHHLIDEWWDEAIGDFLRWLFSVQSFDVFIVNYSWLSRAFEYAPPWTFKILDTHDKVSGRCEMLAALGLEPEFFYTTENEESVALQRADLVWAIKDEERASFEGMSAVPVLTLPHLDAARALGQPVPDPEGFLRVGIIGARNNVNRTNITEFLKAAEPIFVEAFAPVKISIAGSVCDLLEDMHYPFVELRGRVESVEGFYRTVDCVAVPMRASTGLKIKTAEALSLGQPLVSLSHAFEGYEPSHPLHKLGDFPEMARALVDLSFAPRSDLQILADASRTSYAKSKALMERSFRSTDEQVRRNARSIVVAVDSRAFVSGSVFNLALMPMQGYLRDLANVTVLVVRGSAQDVLGNREAISRVDRVVVADDVAGAMEARQALAAVGADVFGAEVYLKRTQPKIVIADALHPALSSYGLSNATLIVRAEIVSHCVGSTDFVLPDRGYRRVFVAAPVISREIAALAVSTGALPLLSPCFVCRRETGIPVPCVSGDAKVIAILGARDAPAVRMAAAMVRAHGMRPLVVRGFGEVTARVSGDATPAMGVDEYIALMLKGQNWAPRGAIDLSLGQLGLALCREVLELMHVPVMTASTMALHGSLGLDGGPYRIATERELWVAIRSLAMESASAVDLRSGQAWNVIDGDRDWHWLRRMSSELFAA